MAFQLLPLTSSIPNTIFQISGLSLGLGKGPNYAKGYPGLCPFIRVFSPLDSQTPSAPIMVLYFLLKKSINSTHGLVSMTSALHAEGRQIDPGWLYFFSRGLRSRIQDAGSGIAAAGGVPICPLPSRKAPYPATRFPRPSKWTDLETNTEIRTFEPTDRNPPRTLLGQIIFQKSTQQSVNIQIS